MGGKGVAVVINQWDTSFYWMRTKGSCRSEEAGCYQQRSRTTKSVSLFPYLETNTFLSLSLDHELRRGDEKTSTRGESCMKQERCTSTSTVLTYPTLYPLYHYISMQMIGFKKQFHSLFPYLVVSNYGTHSKLLRWTMYISNRRKNSLRQIY